MSSTDGSSLHCQFKPNMLVSVMEGHFFRSFGLLMQLYTPIISIDLYGSGRDRSGPDGQKMEISSQDN